MGVGIIEPKSAHVPGTSRLYDGGLAGGGERGGPRSHSHLKHGAGKESDILLVPQPSDSPNDPLVSGSARICETAR